MTTQEQFSIQTHKDNQKAHAKVEGIVPKDMTGKVYDEVLQEIRKSKKIDGFREGTAPPEIVEREVGSLEVWATGCTKSNNRTLCRNSSRRKDSTARAATSSNNQHCRQRRCFISNAILCNARSNTT